MRASDLEYWRGFTVRTERPLTRDEFVEWVPLGVPDEDWSPGYLFGGEGLVVGFVERDGRCWIQSDEGYEWVIDERTSIRLVTRD